MKEVKAQFFTVICKSDGESVTKVCNLAYLLQLIFSMEKSDSLKIECYEYCDILNESDYGDNCI